MVDFYKKIKNSDKFRGPAIRFEMTGSFCSYPPGTSEYYKFWETEMDRCINGYTADDGDFITGYNYFYLNYCPIKKIYRKEITRNGVTKLRTFREEGFASFYDYDYFYFQAIDEAEFQGRHLPVLKARGKGYSFKGASMLCRNFFLIPDSTSYAFAATKEYLLKDGILSKTKDIIDFINENTAWTKKMDVKNTEMHRRASFQVTDEAGNKIEVGYKSEIIGVVLDDPNKARGKRCKLALIEEAGSCNDLLTAIQILRPSVEEDGEAYGIIIPFGTGGEEGVNFEGLKELFFHGNGYNFLQFDNIWSEGAQGSECGFFVPEWANMSKTDENGNRLYMDKDGNSLMHRALQLISSEREKVVQGATNSQAVDRYIAEHPITPEEACLTLTGNIFPKKELQLQLAKIRTNKKLQNLKQVGNLYLENGEAKWTPKKSGDITSYHIKKREKSDLDRYIGDDFSGSIVIWEHPPKDPPLGMYIACCDPYDHDHSGTNSLGSTFIYKRSQAGEEYSDVIVAEYTGRPATAEEYYENVRKLLLYYNARMMCENQNVGIISYFTNKHCDYLLADQPGILQSIVTTTTSKVHRKKGSHVSKEIKLWGLGKLKEWLLEEFAPGHRNLERIYSEPLLEELISYNDQGNFDRVMSLVQLMIYKEDLYDSKVKEIKKEEKNNRLFELPIFSDAWFNQANDDNNPLFNTKPYQIDMDNTIIYTF